MIITQISYSDMQGGAARAAYRLYKGLGLLDHKSFMAVREKKSKDPNVVAVIPDHYSCLLDNQIFYNIVKKEIVENRSPLSDTYFSLPYPGFDISNTNLIKKSDIINLHWVTLFQSVESISSLQKLKKPIIWTLHDQNSFTGGCHYSSGCKKYKSDCRDCPQLANNLKQISYNILKNKIKLWKNSITIVTPSKWLAECARESALFKKYRIETIPNSIETEIFSPQKKQTAKSSFNIPTNIKTLLFAAEHNAEKRKGFHKLVEALQYCKKNKKFQQLNENGELLLLTFGNPETELENIGIPIKSFGYINDDKKIASIYSAADIYILPSLEDNLPNNLLESMSCGTPVIAFNTGGIKDVIQHEKTGLIAEHGNTQELANHILKIIFNEKKRTIIGINSRKKIEEKYSLNIQANKYLELYNDIIGNTKRCLKKQSVSNINQEIKINGYNSDMISTINHLYIKEIHKIYHNQEQQLNYIKKLFEENKKLLQEKDRHLQKNIYNKIFVKIILIIKINFYYLKNRLLNLIRLPTR